MQLRPEIFTLGMQLTEDDVEEVDALYMQNLRGIVELSGGEITIDNFHEVTFMSLHE